jgi:multimeric flavodoxin WrbA
MAKKILVISGSPKKDGNTAALISWFAEGACSKNATIEIVQSSSLKNKSHGCISCRKCQTIESYECVINDDIKPVLKKMTEADVIVMATPLYFFSASAQLKLVFDRMFCLYKWDNAAGTMKTVLADKTLVLLASAYEDVGLEALAMPFKLTAEYSKMKFESLLVANAGVSGDINKKGDVRGKAISLGAMVAA